MLQLSSFNSALGFVLLLSSATAGPCDIYGSRNTPCVAAHSTTRALFDAYTGPLYQVSQGYNGRTMDVEPLSAGGVANASAQDNFCTNSDCLISIIYDQSGHGNHLTQAPPGPVFKGPQPGGYDSLAPATGAPITLNGHRVYGVYVSPRTGYRNNNTTGIAVKDEPEGIYAVLDGTHYNAKCCFGYGNAETTNNDDGDGTMESLTFGKAGRGPPDGGSGPWIKADLEGGLYGGKTLGGNTNNPSRTARFLHAVIKGNSGNFWAIRGGSATVSGSLKTAYSGERPDKFNPMRKEGGIVLGIGGDNSNVGEGTFYEGAITSGFPLDATENSVHENIVAAKYST